MNVITIDGPAGAGKSTIAKYLAKQLNWTYCDTGAMYRAVTLACIQNSIDLADANAIAQELESIGLTFDGSSLLLNGVLLGDEIRSLEVNKHVSFVAAIPVVRKFLLKLQRQFAEKGKVIMEGRDIGSVIFPKAKYKFYLDADLEERAQRRHLEYKKKGTEINAITLEKQISRRDTQDYCRLDSPLIIPSDAITIDTTGLSIEDVLNKILFFFKEASNEDSHK